jgi:hypothetical protein
MKKNGYKTKSDGISEYMSYKSLERSRNIEKSGRHKEFLVYLNKEIESCYKNKALYSKSSSDDELFSHEYFVIDYRRRMSNCYFNLESNFYGESDDAVVFLRWSFLKLTQIDNGWLFVPASSVNEVNEFSEVDTPYKGVRPHEPSSCSELKIQHFMKHDKIVISGSVGFSIGNFGASMGIEKDKVSILPNNCPDM